MCVLMQELSCECHKTESSCFEDEHKKCHFYVLIIKEWSQKQPKIAAKLQCITDEFLYTKNGALKSDLLKLLSPLSVSLQLLPLFICGHSSHKLSTTFIFRSFHLTETKTKGLKE